MSLRIHLDLLQRLARRSRAVVSSVAWAGYTRFSGGASRRFGWIGASEPLRLAGPNRAADTRAAPEGLAYVLDAPVE